MNRIIIDVREPSEYRAGHVEGAINLPPSELLLGADKLHNVPKDTELILYCLSGSRSNAAMNILRQFGFTNISNGINQDQVRARFGL